MLQTINYPILHLFKADKNIYTKAKGPELASTSLFGIFKDSYILDAQGKFFQVRGVRRVGWAYFFGYHPLMKGRTARVEYEFEDVNQLALPKFKEYVIERLKSGVSKGFWYSKKDIPMLIRKVEDASSYSVVVECFM
ncbi:hypothetical protein [Pedobacter faecalis]|uniref:hypothetical protein n=1 Tax=Pedobacter faecalis TaxID=3041495 RepID=UPI00254AE5E4|nr:hypothetical protein [Pedobacter sp. ELA7]